MHACICRLILYSFEILIIYKQIEPNDLLSCSIHKYICFYFELNFLFSSSNKRLFISAIYCFKQFGHGMKYERKCVH